MVRHGSNENTRLQSLRNYNAKTATACVDSMLTPAQQIRWGGSLKIKIPPRKFCGRVRPGLVIPKSQSQISILIFGGGGRFEIEIILYARYGTKYCQKKSRRDLDEARKGYLRSEIRRAKG